MKSAAGSRKTIQDIQDDIFRKMSPDEKVELGAKLWRLAKELVGDKIRYDRSRSTMASSKRS